MWAHWHKAAIIVTAVLIAGALAKLGHDWCGIGVMSSLCLVGGVIERLTSRRQASLSNA